MKYKGKQLSGPNIDYIVFPRNGGNEEIVFKLQAILDYSMFDKLMPKPLPPVRMKPGGERIADYNDPIYKQSEDQYSHNRLAWIVIHTIKNDDIEWEKVDKGDSNTWRNYEQELLDSGLSPPEIQRLITSIFSVNALDESKIKEARDRFLAIQVQEVVE